MTELRQKMKMDMELRGFSARTIKYYLENVARFAKYFNKSPELLGEEEIRQYLHYCIMQKKLCEGTVGTIYSSIKFLYTKTLARPWNVDKLPRMKVGRKLPAILSQSEVKAILDATENLKHKTILMTIYAAGLRVSEVSNLRTSDIDSKNMQIAVRQGKGKKDRYSLLSEVNLLVLRQYWRKYQPDDLLFQGKLPGEHISVRAIQKVFAASKAKAGIKKAASVHTLRHCFATHLLEADANICSIQRLMGHTSLQTTTKYLHLRRADVIKIKSPLENLGFSKEDLND